MKLKKKKLNQSIISEEDKLLVHQRKLSAKKEDYISRAKSQEMLKTKYDL